MLIFSRLFLPFMAGCILTATMGNTAFSAESRIAGLSSASGTWTSKSCPKRDDNQWMLVGLKLVKYQNKTQQVAAICKGGLPRIAETSYGRPLAGHLTRPLPSSSQRVLRKGHLPPILFVQEIPL